jgi:light-regulated signal transduction histidine kinase (bacteriophytochrome)
VEQDGERFTTLYDYTDGCASTVGNYQLSLFGARAVDTLHSGQTLIIRNVEAELLPAGGADMFNAIGIKAIINCPLVKEGRMRAMMAVHQTTARDWKPAEITIVHDVVERCWATIERRTAEENIRQLNAELEQRVVERTAQMEAANKELEAFSYSVSHDLRAPLRAVDGFSQAVVEDYGQQLPEEGRRYLQAIREGAQRMGSLIDDLLDFARLSRQSLNKRAVDTEGLVRDAIEDLALQREGRQIEIRTGDLPPCQGDPALLKQVWVNLLSNAIKYTRKCERAVLETGCVREKNEDVYFVRDNGTGFDMKYAHKLFGVFQRLHRAEDYEGTGVGLAIVQRVIHRHSGRIWAEAAVDRGATFYFTLGDENKS